MSNRGAAARTADVRVVLLQLQSFNRRLARTWPALSPDISMVDLSLLRLIGDASGITAAELAIRLRIDKSTASRQLSALAERGLVDREPLPGGRRARALTLTPAGQAAVADTQQRNLAALERRFAGWSSDDVAQFAALLSRFNDESV